MAIFTQIENIPDMLGGAAVAINDDQANGVQIVDGFPHITGEFDPSTGETVGGETSHVFIGG